MSDEVSSGHPIGLIGVGLMGTAFAHRLRGAGLPVVGFDVDPARLDDLVAIGGERVASIAEVTRCPIILIVVFSADQAQTVLDEITTAARAEAVRHGEGEKDSTVIVEDLRRRVARPATAQRGASS